MISLVTDVYELDFLPDDPFCAKITCLLNQYGTNTKFALFYVIKKDAVPTGALSSVDGNATVYCSESTDFEELKFFIKTMNYLSVSCNLNIANKLDLKKKDSSIIVKYTGNNTNPSDTGEIQVIDYRDIYNLLVECGFDLHDYNSFLVDFASRINHGLSQIITKDIDGITVGCAAVLFKGNKSNLMGSVAVKKEYRNIGIARELVVSLAEVQSKTVYLFCRNDSLLKFYEKCGFEQIGRWCLA